MWRRLPATTLIKQHDPVNLRIKELPVVPFTGSTRATVYKYDGEPICPAAFLDVQIMSV
jgi:hypothetical protein